MKKIIFSLVLPLVMVLSSCKETMDINNNPNYPADAAPEMLLPSGIISAAGIVGGEMELVGGFWSQHYTQNYTANQYKPMNTYIILSTNYNSFWSNLYAKSLEDLKLVISKSTEAGQDNLVMMAKVLTAFDYSVLSQWYGSIPFSEALDGSNIDSPKYEDSKTVVIPGIVAMLDEAIAMATTAKTKPSAGKADMVFAGNIDSWVKFAKTLKLKMLMLSEVDFPSNAVAIEALLNEGDLLNVDAGVIGKFEDVENKSNPLNQSDRIGLNTKNNIRGCSTVVEFFKTNKDPRVAAYFEPNSKNIFLGLKYGDFTVLDAKDANYSSRARLAATDAVYFMTASESYFLQAEAWARLANVSKAKEAYDNGMLASFARANELYGVYTGGDATNETLKVNIAEYVASYSAAQLDGSAYIAVGGVYEFKASSLENMLKQILTQKWISSIRTQAWNSFFDINRTGIPALGDKFPGESGYVSGQLTPCYEGSALQPGQFPRRMLYPSSSTSNNGNAPKVEDITESIWWQK